MTANSHSGKLSFLLSMLLIASSISSLSVILLPLEMDTVQAVVPPWADDMEAGPGNWKSYSNNLGTEWEWGIPQQVGPNMTHSGIGAWGTNIASNYTNGGVAYLESPPFDLALSTNTILEFWMYMDTDDFFTHDWDGGLIEISTDAGKTWVQLDDGARPNPLPYYDAILRNTTGNPLGGRMSWCYDRLNWTRVVVDLSDYDGYSNLIFRLVFGSDLFVDSPGWYIDDVSITAIRREGVVIEPDHYALIPEGVTRGFNLTITNLQSIPEVVDIGFVDDEGWSINLLQSDGITPLADTGGIVGLPDTGLLTPASQRGIVVEVTVPPGTPYSTENIVRLDAIPFYGSVPWDTAYIRISTPSPDVAVTRFDVGEIQISGEEVNVTAFVTNLGNFTQSFDVRLDIYGPGRITFDPIVHVQNLGAGKSEIVNWSLTPVVPGEYTLTVTTLLLGDSVEENNASTRMMNVFSPLFEDDMEIGGPAASDQWKAGSSPQTAWQLGTPTAVGPTTCHSLSSCWGTNLDSQYEKDADIRLETPPINLSNSERIILRFWHYYDINGPFRNDGGFVEVSQDGGSNWKYIQPLGGYPGSVDLSAPTPPGGGSGAYAGSSLSWEVAFFNLTSFAGGEVIIGFHLWSDSSNFQPGWAGWYIDDVIIAEIPIGSRLLFTEIQDSGVGGERIEVYNAGKELDDLSNYLILRSDNSPVNGSWSRSQIGPGEYSVFTATGDELDDDGDYLRLINSTSNWVEDEVGYGQLGVVQDPPDGQSTGRFWNGTEYQDYWSWSPISSFGADNIGESRLLEPDVVLNEVFFNPLAPGDEFIEIYYKGTSTVNLKNYMLFCDSLHIIPLDIVLDATRNHYILRPSEYPSLFSEMAVTGENLYLYSPNASFMDMVGWSSPHNQGESMSRVPEGNGTHNGYDDPSSIQAGWHFGREPTMALISVWPDQTKYGDPGEKVSFDLFLLNQPEDDSISFRVNKSAMWEVDLLQSNGTPIVDTNFDGLLDTGYLPASSFFNFTVNVTVPSTPPIGDEIIVEVYVNSSINNAKDLVVLITRTPPHLEPWKYAEPGEIFLEGVGLNEVATVTLEVDGGGFTMVEQHPQDTVFIIDGSESMATNDPLNLRLEAAKNYVDNMTFPDRGAVVEFNDVASLVPPPGGDHLTSNYTRIKQNIDTIGANGGTNIGAGLQAANAELINYGNSTHLWVEILLTDGHESSSNYIFTSQQIQNAADNNITIFTIGLGAGANETLLKEIADRTGGKYYFAKDAEALKEIYGRIGLLVFDIAGRDTNVSDAEPMIRDVVPPYIHVDYTSFSRSPDVIYNTTEGVVFEWNVSQISVNESWKVSYEIRCSRLGWVSIGVYPSARVEYVKWDNMKETIPFPDAKIYVLLPPVGPPTNLRASVVNTNDIQLDWLPPVGVDVSYYLIYRSENQTGFDFSSPIHNTSLDPEPTRTNWTDIGAAGQDAPREYYYILKAVDVNGTKSISSNTVGKWTKTFRPGLSTFSLPLEPFSQIKVSQLAARIPNTEFIRWMDATGRWVTHFAGAGEGVNDTLAIIGKGYEISVLDWTNHTFVGFPGAMILHRDGFGDVADFRKSLTLALNMSNVTLRWQGLPGSTGYEIYRSTRREGLHEPGLLPIGIVDGSAEEFTDYGQTLPGSEFYYWVIPIGPNGERGSGTYSIGLRYDVFRAGSDTFALPLKIHETLWLSEICNGIGEIAGLAYMDNGSWKYHSREMPSYVYDLPIQYGVGYQVSAFSSFPFVFIGR